MFAFDLNQALLLGYFGDYTSEELIEMCFNGLLIYEYAIEFVEEDVGSIVEFQCLDDLRKWLKQKVEHSLGITKY